MAQELTPAGVLYPGFPGRPEINEAPEATKQIFFVLFKWKRLILSIFAVFAVAAGTAMYLMPPVRSATAEILIRVDRMPLQISGLAARVERNQISQIMNSEVQLIKSRHVLGSVAMKLLSNPHKDEGVSEEELKGFVKERLAPYKYPRYIEFVEELPKTATGKIQRFRLREREQQG